MLNINKIRTTNVRILVLGNHAKIIQSILDFDYLTNKQAPSITAVIGNSSGYLKYFWGSNEVLIPQYSSLDEVSNKDKITYFLNLVSKRRVLQTSKELINALPSLVAGVVFAENLPEAQALELYHLSKLKKITLIGASSVGLLVPSVLKLGPIAGITLEQVNNPGILSSGNIAVMSASGGMTNELINIVNLAGYKLSFALSFGGDRFPLITLPEAFLAAEKDKQTKAVVYYGELGGFDEYEMIKLITKKKFTKPIIAHIAGTVSELFPQKPQFGHAKAKAATALESAKAKRKALKEVGVTVGNSFTEFVNNIKNISY